MTKIPGRDTSSARGGRLAKRPFFGESRRFSRHWLIGGGWSPDFSRSYWTIILVAVTFAACVVQSLIGWDVVEASFGFVPSAVWMPSTWLSTLPGQAIPVAATWLTYVFPHMGWFHMISNVIALLMFGTVIEPMIGTGRYIALTLVGTVLGVFGLAAIHPLGMDAIAGGSQLVCTIVGFWLATFSQDWWRKHKLGTLVLEMAALGSLVAWLAFRIPSANASALMGVVWHVPALLVGWFSFRIATFFCHGSPASADM